MLAGRLYKLLGCAVVLTCAALSVAGIHPELTGNGGEYLLMSEAFLDHGAPNITEKQYQEINGYSPNVGTNISRILKFSTLGRSPPYYRSLQGKYYSFHFWLYSLLVAPFLWLAKAFGYAMPWAFIWFNLMMAMAASCAIYACQAIPRASRLLILSLFWGCGTIPYIRWTHPEVFTASLLALAFTLYEKGKYCHASLLSAIAAQQNPPAIFLAALFLAKDFAECFSKDKGFVFPGLARLGCWPCCILASSMSAVFFWLHFGAYNLIAHVGMARYELISLERLFSLYFDMNQGMVILLWPLFVLIPFLLIANSCRQGNWRNPGLFGFSWLLLLSLLLAVPALSTTNWNSGESYVMRYAYWASIPLVFSVRYLFFENVYIKSLYVVFACALVVQGWQYAKFPKRYTEKAYTPWAEFVLDHAPQLYNPVPEIFVERGRHAPHMSNKEVYLYSHAGEISKILLNTSKNSISDIACFDGRAAQSYVQSTVSSESGWRYYNLERGCAGYADDGYSEYRRPRLISLPAELGSDDDEFYVSGCSTSEPGHRWSNGRRSIILFALNTLPRSGLGIEIRGSSLGSQHVKVSANGHAVFEGKVPEGGFPVLKVDKALLNVPVNVLTFDFPDARTPGNGDGRILAFSVVVVRIYAL